MIEHDAAQTDHTATPRAERRRGRVSATIVVLAALAIVGGVGTLGRAHAAGGDDAWSPLAAGEYFHTVTSSFDPVIPARHADPAKQVAGLYRWSHTGSTERWVDVDGRGRTIQTDGLTGDPDLFPGVIRDPKTHVVRGFGGFVDRQGQRVDNPTPRSAEDRLRYPDTVNVTDRPRGTALDTATMWVRQPAGYVSDGTQQYRRRVVPGKQPATQAQVEMWGASLRDLRHLDDLRGAELRSAVRTLLDRKDPNGSAYPRPGSYDVTAASLASNARVLRAIKLLDSAPLAPAARQEMFRAITAEPKHKLTPNAKDRLGRVGTRVTFETIYDRDLPGHRITGAAAWKLAGGTGPVPATVKPYYDLPAYHAFRRWYVDVIFDRASGELLQYAYYARWRNNGRTPRLTGRWRKPTGIKFYSGESMGETDSGLAGVRERTTQITPVSPVCSVDATPCAPSSTPYPKGS